MTTDAAVRTAGPPQPPVDDAPVHVDHRARMEILGAIMLGLFLSALDQTIVGPILPRCPRWGASAPAAGGNGGGASA